MAELFEVITIAEAKTVFSNHITMPRETEKVPLSKALGRSLARDIRAECDVPGFDRSTVDGFAVRAGDTFGACESMPAYLDITGEVMMGREPQTGIGPGQVVRIATGGMLPPGSDAVVMVEYTEELGKNTIGVLKPVAPGENVIRRGEDVKSSEPVLHAGRRLKPSDLGILAAVGVTEPEVFRPLKVGIISTGDEVVAACCEPGPAKVRDINSSALCGAVEESGGTPRFYGIVKDDFQSLYNVMRQVCAENEMVILSGGSSVGIRDVAARVIASLGEPGILFHGLAVKPGKPTIGASVGGKPVFGLPGHPASAMVVFYLLAEPLIRDGKYAREDGWRGFPVRARISRNLRSAAGREDFIRIRLYMRGDELWAEPILGKSGLITTLIEADGLARIPAAKEGVEAGETVEIMMF